LISAPSTRGVSITAAILLVASQLVRLGVGLWMGPDSAQSWIHLATYGLALLATSVLLLALTAIYARVSAATRTLGLVGYAIALAGTVLVAGDWWFEAFVVPALASAAPDVLTSAPSGSVLAGALATIGLYTVGWTLFGVAALRTRSIPRAAAILLIVAGLAGPLVLTAPYQIPLAVAVGWIGYSLSQARGVPVIEESAPGRPPARNRSGSAGRPLGPA
jgi:hypothetical protein